MSALGDARRRTGVVSSYTPISFHGDAGAKPRRHRRRHRRSRAADAAVASDASGASDGGADAADAGGAGGRGGGGGGGGVVGAAVEPRPLGRRRREGHLWRHAGRGQSGAQLAQQGGRRLRRDLYLTKRSEMKQTDKKTNKQTGEADRWRRNEKHDTRPHPHTHARTHAQAITASANCLG